MKQRILRIIRGIAIILMLGGSLFLPAGRLNWPEAWAFLVFYVGYVLTLAIWMRRNDPELLRERTRVADNVKSWDKSIMAAYTVLLAVMLGWLV